MKWTYRALALLSFLCCVWIALANPGQFLRGTMGDVLVVFFMFFLLQSVRVFPRIKLASAILVFACLVEAAQGLGVSSWLGAERGSIVHVVIGSTFDWSDCIAYAAGLIAACALDWTLVRAVFHEK